MTEQSVWTLHLDTGEDDAAWCDGWFRLLPLSPRRNDHGKAADGAADCASDDDEVGDVEHGHFLDGVVMFVPVTSDSATHWKTDCTTAVNVDCQAANAR